MAKESDGRATGRRPAPKERSGESNHAVLSLKVMVKKVTDGQQVGRPAPIAVIMRAGNFINKTLSFSRETIPFPSMFLAGGWNVYFIGKWKR